MENLFLVCLVPPVTIVEDIDEIKNHISQKFNVHESLKRPAHITLYNPVKLSSQEEERKFFKALEDASFAESFTQILRNFNSFDKHTFYLDVAQNSGIMNLQAEIKKELKPLKLLQEQDNFKFTPHLTLAFKDVKPLVMDLIIAEFKDKKFKREFQVSGFSVYKHINKRWQPFKEFKFKKPLEKPKSFSLFD
ncbi:2'-5' RNA ligase family protein [Pedobacter frigidisoli]|uniref:2'-5' RNA ligase family protein n=1 Tax=Pedobacter frigidisoli TaxID=2530455 RepID=A0A4V2MMT7_9SPHI|nr:2'-5' RNA ligase family protein [Pedobacter frigidisoli]TCD08556.1 2'-5' RNA ligase family protein [Pedobacter frigidisoli]